MGRWIPAGLVAASFVLLAVAAHAQYGAVSLESRKQCLSDKELETIKYIKSLTRLTTEKDPAVPFNPDYFLGTWKQSWINSEVPWSSAGLNESTVSFKYIENCFYEGHISANGPD